MSSEPKRIYGWAVNTPIPMVGGGEAFVVRERVSSDCYVLAGYRIHTDGTVVSMCWNADGATYVGERSEFYLDQSHRKLLEPELPLWTIADSEALLGKVLRFKEERLAQLTYRVSDDGACNVGGVWQSYHSVSEKYIHLDGTPIPQRRMPL